MMNIQSSINYINLASYICIMPPDPIFTPSIFLPSRYGHNSTPLLAAIFSQQLVLNLSASGIP